MTEKYAPSQIILHWLTLVLLAVTYTTIEIRGVSDHGTWLRALITAIHFSAGASVLPVMLLRIFLHSLYPTPAITPPVHPVTKMASHIFHAGIYILFILLPVVGLTSRYFAGKEWILFGFTMPVSAPPSQHFAQTLIHWHEILATTGYWIIGLHALAALYHHYLIHDNTLLRMLPRKDADKNLIE